MPVPNTKVLLNSTILAGGGYSFTTNAPGDLAPVITGSPTPQWISGITDLNGDGLADFIFGAPGDDDKFADAGRIFISLGAPILGNSGILGTGSAGIITIDGVHAGDRAGAAVGSIADLNGDGRAEILVGAPGMDKGAALDAGAAFVLWGMGVTGGIDLNDPFSGGGSGKGYAIKGEAAGDAAGGTIMSVGDMNGDGLADVLVGAVGNDAGGVDAGAVYVVWGKANDAVVQLTSVAAGTGGFKIIGAGGGDAVGSVLASLGDQNGDGRSEILIGVADDKTGGQNAGAVYVVDGKATGGTVNLANVANGIGGYVITGVAQDDAGAAVANAGDVNGDGRDDILIGAPRSDRAYVVYGQSGHANVNLATVRSGVGGFQILGEVAGDLDSISVTGGVDLNRDGIADFVIGAAGNDEGGSNAGAVYVVWGGSGSGTVDLALVAQGIGGAKIVGAAGSLTGSTVAITADANGDGVADLMIGAPGVGEGVKVLFTPTSWQPDHNIYGTAGADLMAPGYGGALKIGAGNDVILGLAGNDTIDGAAGNDTIEGGNGNDSLLGGLGNDRLDGESGADIMAGGAGDDTYVVDAATDVVTELPGQGIDTVLSAANHTLSADVENLTLTVAGRIGTGNTGANVLTGTGGSDTLNGATGADTLFGGAGADLLVVDDIGDVVVELAGGGNDTIRSGIDYVLGAEVENLILTGAARIGTGNALANSLTGTAGSDTLDGSAGIDTMAGGNSNDTYIVDNAADQVVELALGGTDTVRSSVNLTLAAEVENLVLTGSALTGTGNNLANSLTGTAGNNTLDGGFGADTMSGGAGNDTYLVDNAGDVVVESAGGGIDTVVASFDYTLTAGEIENLTLTGAAHVGTGNASANAITGGSGADTIDGGGGADLLTGGAGDDRYIVDASDTVVELAGGGIDTMVASVNITLAAEVERLELSGTGTTGTGNALDNLMTGGAGNQNLIGLDGNDSLDGGTGADTMEGGNGDDTFVIDDAGDVVIETATGGIDTVVTAFDTLTMAANIENIRLTGTAHVAVGNAGNNVISGAAGNDVLDGGGGDDLILAGDGNDDLRSSSGIDTLSGGSGDDVYHVSGGQVEIEDFLGHDTLDSSDSTTDDTIDLSGATDSEIENEICHITPGGTTASPLDVQFLQDLSGSFGDDIATVRGLVPQLVAALQTVQANSMFGVSSFIDKPISPFGATGEWVYKQELGLTANAAALAATYNAMGILFGADGPEAQIEGLMQLALHAAEVGFRPDAARFVVLFTDAPYHVAGDGAAGGILTPNNGDPFFPAGGALEDYPSVAQLQAALQAANIIPIFAIAGGYDATYQNLVTMLGRGAEVTLTANSSNIVAAITAGLTAATTTHIEDANCGSGNDTVGGGVEDNHIRGNAGNDHIDGRTGNDTLDGGDGDDLLTGGAGDDALIGGLGSDTLILSGNRADYSITATATGYILTDIRVGAVDGTDTVSGVEFFTFADGTVAASGLSNAVPVAVADSGTALTEATATAPGIATATGNLLANDTDADLLTPGSTEVLTVAQARAGDLAAGGALAAVTTATAINGLYGTLTLNPDGSYSYALDNTRAATQALIGGQTVQEVFTYQITDAAGAPSQATLSFAINGADDVIPVASIADTDTAANLIAENSANGVAVGFTAGGLDAGGAAVPATFTLVTDATGTATDATGPFQIDAATGLVTVRDGTLLNFEAAASHVIWVKATSPDGGSVVTSFTIAVADVFEPVVVTPVLTALADTFTAITNDHHNINSLAGNDIITTLAGNDTIRGGLGNDTMASGDGNDTFTVSGTGDGFDAIDGGLGTDTIVALKAATAIGVSTLTGVEAISSGGFAGVYLRGSTTNNVIDLSAATLTGIIRIEGGAGNDTITGSAAADTIFGGTGNDVLAGGGGDDLFTVSGGAEGVDAFNGGTGIDTISAAINGTAIQMSSIAGIEVIAASGHTGVSIKGSALANTLDFSTVTLTGIAVIDAGAGNDTVVGSAGNDVIAASAGLDLLTGGLGVDRFDFNLASESRGATIDQIMDFTSGLDVIDLLGVDANTLALGDQAFTFIGAAAFGLVAGELRLATVGGQTRLQGDVDGNGTVDFTVQLTGVVGSPVAVLAGDILL